MNYAFPNARQYRDGSFVSLPFTAKLTAPATDAAVCDSRPVVILPGFCDVHVHLREPGFSYKETIHSGTAAAARGGYTDVCAMPNLSPVPDSVAAIQQQWALIRQDAVIGVHPYAAITVGEKGETLVSMEELSPLCVAFSDDGKGVQNESYMRQAMERAAKLGKIIAAHCEDESLLRGGYIHDGVYARAHGHRGICSESEWGPIQRDLKLAKETGCRYHVCHISTKESVALIRAAKAEGVDVTCETGPHYLTLCDEDLQEDGRFKMNPPLRSRADKEALIEGLLDGTIDMIATDHAPHSAEEKSRGLAGSNMGVVGLETAFPVMYTHFVKTGILSLDKLVALMADNPRKRFGIADTGDVCVWDLEACGVVDPKEFLSLGHSTPFAGDTLYGKNILTIYGGKAVWQKND
ncbi:MAG: dihydroorotase [Clostridia bacterium]|nr:dihydroorotase [Clostridia bacterium]